MKVIWPLGHTQVKAWAFLERKIKAETESERPSAISQSASTGTALHIVCDFQELDIVIMCESFYLQ